MKNLVNMEVAKGFLAICEQNIAFIMASRMLEDKRKVARLDCNFFT